jgi:glutaredoxin
MSIVAGIEDRRLGECYDSHMRHARIALLLITALASGSSLAQVYRWTDAQGRVHITDTPPPAGAKGVQKRSYPSAGSENSEPYALQMARKNAPVTLYSTPGCAPCAAARDLLNARGVPFKEVSVVDNAQIEEVTNAVGRNAVPSLLVGGSAQAGFEEGLYHGMLDAAGYPKTGVLPPRAQAEPTQSAPADSAAPAAQAPSGPYAPGARRQRQQKK